MAHFALVKNNKVKRVIAVSNNVLLDENNNEVEQKGIDFCVSLYGDNGEWIQTSYNGTIRKNYAGVGFTYDGVRDAFIPPKTHPSWVLNETTCRWEAPIALPDNENDYEWNEANTSWVSI